MPLDICCYGRTHWSRQRGQRFLDLGSLSSDAEGMLLAANTSSSWLQVDALLSSCFFFGSSVPLGWLYILCFVCRTAFWCRSDGISWDFCLPILCLCVPGRIKEHNPSRSITRKNISVSSSVHTHRVMSCDSSLFIM